MKINLHIKVLVGVSLFSTDFQVFEFSKIIPKYCFYIILRDLENEYNDDLQQGIIFNVNARRDRLLIWIEENFNIHKDELVKFIAGDYYDIRFMSLRTDKILQIFMRDNEIRILTDEIELAGNIFQDLCVFFKVDHLETTINFPDNVQALDATCKRIQKHDNMRNNYNINMTDIISRIKELFVRAEDSRLMDDIDGFINYFKRINIKNQEILDEFKNRTEIYEALITDLKKLNEIIQLFSNLKYGNFKNKLISNARQCIKDKNYSLLISTIQANP